MLMADEIDWASKESPGLLEIQQMRKSTKTTSD
jgi:hypothetical protein